MAGVELEPSGKCTLSKCLHEENEDDDHVKPALARMDAACTRDAAKMSALQFGQIQTGGATFIRRLAEYVCATSDSLHVLLAALLLVRIA